MKYIFLLLLAICSSVLVQAQPEDCIDPSLIDPDAFCTFIYDPVCGCDGVTYSNECVAEVTAGVTSWTIGECPPSVECLDLGGLDFGECAMPLGIALINGTCSSISGCSYIASDNEDYEAYFYDTYQDCQADCSEELDCYDLGGIDFGPCDAVLGIGLLNGSCSYISGCDVVVDEVDYSPYFYENEEDCESACGGCYDESIIDFNVFCSNEYDPVCGCDGVSYMNSCVAYYQHGITEWTNGPCSCPDPAIQDVEAGCDTSWEPVCGCDGVTYGNACEAWYWGGITEWTEGECTQIGECTDVGGVDFGLCEMIIGYAVSNGECTVLSGCGTTDPNGVDYAAAFFTTQEACEATCDNVILCIDSLIIDQQVLCTEEYDPVCGCDSVTYNNECMAYNWYGVTSWTAGTCEGEVLCIDSLLIDPDVLCTSEWDPVCGCDSVTYTNGCVALNWYGVSSWTEGECDTITSVLPIIGSQFSLFPNPAHDVLSVNSDNNREYDISITDISGRLIFRLQNAKGKIDLNISAYQRGMYMVTLQSKSGEASVHRVIVE